MAEKGAEDSGRGDGMKGRQVLMTGATGYIGRELARRLLEAGAEVGVVTADPARARDILGVGVPCWGREECLADGGPLQGRQLLLHAGFARPYAGEAEIARSLEFTGRLFARAAEARIPAVLLLSSRSVYGRATPPPWSEESPPAPSNPYGEAKFASEVMLGMVRRFSPLTRTCAVRLGTVSGGGEGLVDVFILSRFVLAALRGDRIRIFGGSQEFDILDLRDAADALARLVREPAANWRPVYNLGSPVSQKIRHLAERAVALAAEHGRRGSVITTEPAGPDGTPRYGMDCARFCSGLGWRPLRSLDDTIRSLIEYYLPRLK